jgi:hypothetical protein
VQAGLKVVGSGSHTRLRQKSLLLTLPRRVDLRRRIDRISGDAGPIDAGNADYSAIARHRTCGIGKPLYGGDSGGRCRASGGSRKGRLAPVRRRGIGRHSRLCGRQPILLELGR